MRVPEYMMSRMQELIRSRSCLHFGASGLVRFQSALSSRAEASGLVSFHDYLNRLMDDPEEFESLIDDLTVKKTDFFRMPEQFNALSDCCLPQIETMLARQIDLDASGLCIGGKPTLRAWSLGCATGEESYSLAMTLFDGLKYRHAWNLDILASDISSSALRKAEDGIYPECVRAKIPEHYRERYLLGAPGGFTFVDQIKRLVSFSLFNLIDLLNGAAGPLMFRDARGLGGKWIDPEGRFHIILCRNVMIYFDSATQQRLIDHLYCCLKPGGWLFTGEAELLNILDHKFETVETDGAIYYRKPQRIFRRDTLT